MNLKNMTAGDLMTTSIETIEASAPLRAAIRKMDSQRVQALIVPPTQPRDGYGIITVKDVIGLLEADADDDLAELGALTVGEVMTRPTISAPTGLGIHQCVSLMRMTGVRRLLVSQGEDVVGILSYTDVFAVIAKQARPMVSAG